MSSTLATRIARPTKAAPEPLKAPARRAVGEGSAVFGREDRPVLRIVADDERHPVVTRVPARQPADPIEVDAPLRRVDLEEFFAVDGRTQELRVLPRRAVRLTRRGRVAVLVVSLAAGLGISLLAASGSAASDHPEQTRVIVVGSGDTLWDIASRTSQGGDIRAAVSHLEELNHLASASVVAGQHLRVPVLAG